MTGKPGKDREDRTARSPEHDGKDGKAEERIAGTEQHQPERTDSRDRTVRTRKP